MQVETLDNYLSIRPEITLAREVHRKHTDIIGRKCNYNFINSRVLISPTEKIEIINKIWITNSHNIKNISIFLVDNNIDYNTITTSTLETLENNNIIILDKLSNHFLNTINNSNNIWEIPVSSKHLIPYVINRANKKILIVIDKINENIESSLILKLLIVNSETEKQRFINISHENLIKKISTCEHEIKKGKNVINYDTINKTLAFLIIIIPKKSSTENYKFDINFKYKIGDSELIQKIVESKYDPEYCKLINTDKVYSYIFDSFDNINSKCIEYPYISLINVAFGNQPKGYLKIESGSLFEIYSEIDTTITIGYVNFDLLKFHSIQNQLFNVYLIDQKYEEENNRLEINNFSENNNNNEDINEDINEVINEVINEYINGDENDSISESNHDNNIYENDIIGINNDDDNDDNDDDADDFNFRINEINNLSNRVMLKMYGSLIYDEIIRLEKSKAVPRLIVDENDKCIISMEKIKTGEYYYKCDKCSAVYEISNLKKWIESNKNMYNSKVKCPHCNCVYSKYPKMYINKINMSIISIKNYFFMNIYNFLKFCLSRIFLK